MAISTIAIEVAITIELTMILSKHAYNACSSLYTSSFTIL